MKRIISLLLAILTVCTLTIGISGCGNNTTIENDNAESEIVTNYNSNEDNSISSVQSSSAEQNENNTNITTPKHEHKYNEKLVAPTCTADGYTLFTCSCGNSYKDRLTKKLGHSFVSNKCTEYEICSVCKVTGTNKGKHNYKNHYCLTCQSVDKSAINITVPNSSKTYNAQEEFTTSQQTYCYNSNYQIKNLSYTINDTAISSYKPFTLTVKFIVSFIDGTYTSTEKNEPTATTGMTFGYSWVHLIDSNGNIIIPTNASNKGKEYTINVTKDNDYEISVRFEHLDAGSYSINFL